MDATALLKEFCSAVERRDGKAFASLFTEDGVYHDVFYGDFKGHARIAEMIDDWFHRTAKDFRWDMHRPVSDGRMLYAYYTFSYVSLLPEANGKRVGFDIHHHDVLAIRNCVERMFDTRARNSGRFDDHLDPRVGDQRTRIIAYEGRPIFMRIIKRGRGIGLIGPACAFQLAPRPRDVEIGDADEMHPRCQPDLRREHRAKFAGADQADCDRSSGGFAFEQLGMKVHRLKRNTGRRARQAALAGQKLLAKRTGDKCLGRAFGAS